MTKLFPHGARIGVLGDGQLGRMFALAARPLGYKVHVLTSDPQSPAAQVADAITLTNGKDRKAWEQFARSIDLATYETENTSNDLLDVVEPFVPLCPNRKFLQMSQHRVREKTSLKDLGLPVGEFQVIHNADDLRKAAKILGFPFILKTAQGGYDGKGQFKFTDEQGLSLFLDSTSWRASQTSKSAEAGLNVRPEYPGEANWIAEAFISFDFEFSIVAARSADGEFFAYPPFFNTHRNHILDVSYCPAELSDAQRERAIQISRHVADAFDVVGVFCIEFFMTPDKGVLVNEIAPRTHNSGHLTIDAFTTSQFELQLRAVTGLSLGKPVQTRAAAMINLLGDLWDSGAPNWVGLLNEPNCKFHLYGKNRAVPGRKMGHVTILSENTEELWERVHHIRSLLRLPKIENHSISEPLFSG